MSRFNFLSSREISDPVSTMKVPTFRVGQFYIQVYKVTYGCIYRVRSTNGFPKKMDLFEVQAVTVPVVGVLFANLAVEFEDVVASVN